MPTAKVYRWDDLPIDSPMAKVERRRVIGQQMMISQIFLHRGFRVPSHHHANEQFTVVLSGVVRFGLGQEGSAEHRSVDVRAGEVLHLPSEVWHSAEAIEDAHLFDLFSPPSERTGIDER